jgi:hypothetical protein
MLKPKDVLVLKDGEDWEPPVGTIFSVVEVKDGFIVINNSRYGNITVLKKYLNNFFKIYYIKYTHKWSSGHSEAEYLVDYCKPEYSPTDKSLEEDIMDYLGYATIINQDSGHYRGFSFEKISREEYGRATGSCVDDNIDVSIKVDNGNILLNKELFEIITNSQSYSEKTIISSIIKKEMEGILNFFNGK